ncbi:MAG: sigma-70 family RNA polymerase sigma factor [Tunicatimonas sp.]
MKSVAKEKFVQILNDHKGIILKVTYAYCSDFEDRKDLEQEIAIQIWRSLKRYDGRAKLSTWIYRVALNVAISYQRKDLKARELHPPLDDVIFRAIPSQISEEPDSRITLLYQFINQLDEFSKAIMLLYLDENSYESIAEVLGTTRTNVATKISRIKKKLRTEFFTVNH